MPPKRAPANNRIAQTKVVPHNERDRRFQLSIERQFKAGDRLLMPLGFYSVTDYIHNTDQMELLANNGITVVQKYTARESTPEKAKREILSAANAGVLMAFCLPTRHFQEDKEWWRKYLLDRNLVNQSQIAFWYLHGEPKPGDVHRLKTVADLLHETDDSHRPVISYHHSIDAVAQKMSGFLDCLVFGSYPGIYKNEGVPRIRIAHKIDAARKVYGIPVIAALEAYNTPSGWPDPEDIKFDACLSLIHGVKGIMWFNYAQSSKNRPLLDAILDVSRLLNGPEHLGEVFLKGQDDPNIQAQLVAGPPVFMDGFYRSMRRDMPNNPSVHWRAYSHRGCVYLAMVNCCETLKASQPGRDEKALTAVVEFRGFEAGSKVAMLEGRARYSYQSELLTVTLGPLGHAVFKVGP